MTAGPDPTHPSRRAWPLRTQPTTTPAGTHDHRIPTAWTVIAVGLAVTLLLLCVVLGVFVSYIVDVRDARNQQIRDVDARINAAVCDVLDQLPEGGLLERPRARYGCGPGIPRSELPTPTTSAEETR